MISQQFITKRMRSVVWNVEKNCKHQTSKIIFNFSHTQDKSRWGIEYFEILPSKLIIYFFEIAKILLRSNKTWSIFFLIKNNPIKKSYNNEKRKSCFYCLRIEYFFCCAVLTYRRFCVPHKLLDLKGKKYILLTISTLTCKKSSI